MRPRIGFIVVLLLVSAWAEAGETTLVVNPTSIFNHAFDPALARSPVPGDWLEYRVAYPADPLEYRLRSEQAQDNLPQEPGTTMVMATGEEYFIPQPLQQPEIPWIVLPLRLEIHEVDTEGCNVMLTFAASRAAFRLLKNTNEATGDLHYEGIQLDNTQTQIALGEYQYEVTVSQRQGAGYGFVRYFSDEVPFGIARFATGDVDLILVAMGRGKAPDFPIKLKQPILPPPGKLYQPVGPTHIQRP